jgi:4-diphosphocytidyl-2-C-methyl-D-erythritol kinase
MAVRELARAKLNLTLGVRGRRSDGYHELESLVAFAQVHDVVTLEPGGDETVTVSGPFAAAIVGENLLARTLELLREADRGLRLGSVHLKKRLPVAAGLGGGSSDAAALLRAVRRANQDRADRVPWLEIAAQLGADVPVCLADRPALMWGKGESFAPIRAFPTVNAVVVNPGVPLATVRVFAALGSDPALATVATPVVPELPDLSALLAYMQARGNDLERAAIGLCPEITEVKALLAAQADCHMAAMSGSGPTCFGIFSGEGPAQRAAAALVAARPGWWAAGTTLAGVPRAFATRRGASRASAVE